MEPRPQTEYTFFNFFCYLFYVPLYVAGPILTFNSFIAQYSVPFSNNETRPTYVAIYFLRIAAAVLLLEVMMHLIYVMAIGSSQAWAGFSSLQLLMLAYLSLKFVWLKFLVIWRFFRAWALLDGVYSVENMNRCMSNNYSAAGFWRSWHRSFNRWLIRYMYIPLGGAPYNYLNMWVIFGFVGFWHDVSLNVIIWGWLICLFLLPEMFCIWLFSLPQLAKVGFSTCLI